MAPGTAAGAGVRWCHYSKHRVTESSRRICRGTETTGTGAAAGHSKRDYTDRISEIARQANRAGDFGRPQMGGIAITQAAENCPKHIGTLVYLCAFLPRDGDSLMTWASQDQESMVNPSTTIPRADGAIDFKPEHSREAFYRNCRDEDAAFAP